MWETYVIQVIAGVIGIASWQWTKKKIWGDPMDKLRRDLAELGRQHQSIRSKALSLLAENDRLWTENNKLRGGTIIITRRDHG